MTFYKLFSLFQPVLERLVVLVVVFFLRKVLKTCLKASFLFYIVQTAEIFKTNVNASEICFGCRNSIVLFM